MCLDKKDFWTKKYKTGWKVLRTGPEGLETPYLYFPVETGKWLVDSRKERLGYYPNRYKTGFHFYIHKADAELVSVTYGVVKKVKVEKITASGMQDDRRVAIAKKIFIVEDS